MDFDKWWGEEGYCEGFTEAEAAWDHQQEIIDELKDQLKCKISINDDLPEDEEPVFAWLSEGNRDGFDFWEKCPVIAYLSRNGTWHIERTGKYIKNKYVTHWMSIPSE